MTDPASPAEDRDVSVPKARDASLAEGQAGSRRTDVTPLDDAAAPQLLESLPDALVVVDGDGCIRLVNGQAERCFGLGRGELIGRPVEVLVPERFHERLRAQRTLFLAAPCALSSGSLSDLVGRREDGGEFTAEVGIGRMGTPEGAFVVVLCRDVTQQRAAARNTEKHLQTERIVSSLLHASLGPMSLPELLAYAFDLLLSVPWIAVESRGAIFLVDPDGGLTLSAHRGLSPEQQSRCAQIRSGECLCGVAALTRELLFAPAVDDRHTIAYEGMHPHGHYVLPLLSCGALVGVLNLYVEEGCTSDVEELEFLRSVADALAGAIGRKQAEYALRASEERFALAVEGTDAGIWDWDLLTNALYLSPRWKGMLGYADHEVAGDYREWETRLHPEERETVLDDLRRYLAGDTGAYGTEYRLRHRDGTYRWIQARGASIRSDDGIPYRMVGSHADVTQSRVDGEALRMNAAKLMVAQRIQRHLVPARAPLVPGFDIFGALHPAEFVGGDYFDFLPSTGGTLGIVIGDVSGHGFHSALLMASVHARLGLLLGLHDRFEDALVHANSLFSQEFETGNFVTMFFAMLDPGRKLLSYVNAGHPSGYQLDAAGRTKTELRSTSLPLGLFPDARIRSREDVRLEPGDLVLLVTDGVLEAESGDGEEFGAKRMLESVRAHRDGSAEEISAALYDAVCRFAGKTPLDDDFTVVVIRVA